MFTSAAMSKAKRFTTGFIFEEDPFGPQPNEVGKDYASYNEPDDNTNGTSLSRTPSSVRLTLS